MDKDKNIKSIICIQGAAFGSESKGLVAGQLSIDRDVDFAVRTGSKNAGHTVPYKGKQYKNSIIPTAWVNLETKLIIGAGAYVDLDLLKREIEMISEATGEDVRERLFIDARAGLHYPKHQEAEKGMHERFGSTGEGVAAAIVDKMKREFGYKRMGDVEADLGYNLRVVDTVKMLNEAYDNGKQILIEGTQGALLDLHLGYYPYVTSRQTNVSNWISEAGLSPNLEYEIILVVRTFPIRVAGNSGMMINEIGWHQLANEINDKRKGLSLSPLVSEKALEEFENNELKVAEEMNLPSHTPHLWNDNQKLQNSSGLVKFYKEIFERMSESGMKELDKLFEYTTVTKKLRRISRFSIDELKYAVMINRPTSLCINFLNYQFPSLFNFDGNIEDSPEYEDICKYLVDIEDKIRISITHINHTPNEINEVRRVEDKFITL